MCPDNHGFTLTGGTPYFSFLFTLGDSPAVTLSQLRTESLKQSKKAVKRVPKGTSAYQAAWILDKDEWRNGSEEDEKGDEEEIMEEAMAQVTELAFLWPPGEESAGPLAAGALKVELAQGRH